MEDRVWIGWRAVSKLEDLVVFSWNFDSVCLSVGFYYLLFYLLCRGVSSRGKLACVFLDIELCYERV